MASSSGAPGEGPEIIPRLHTFLLPQLPDRFPHHQTGVPRPPLTSSLCRPGLRNSIRGTSRSARGHYRPGHRRQTPRVDRGEAGPQCSISTQYCAPHIVASMVVRRVSSAWNMGPMPATWVVDHGEKSQHLVHSRGLGHGAILCWSDGGERISCGLKSAMIHQWNMTQLMPLTCTPPVTTGRHLRAAIEKGWE